jgi:predicted aconitase with swiveling domain
MTIKGRKVTGGKARGIALVCSEPICYLGGIDVKTGMVTEVGHQLQGQSIAGKVLVFPTGKGSTGGSYLIYEATMNGKGPVAMINMAVEQVTAIGCIMAEVPLVDRPDVNVCEVIKSGMTVEVDADAGLITIID